MKRLFALSVICISLLCAALWGTRVAGRTVDSPIQHIFHDPDGKACEALCLFGAVPGQTRYYEAYNLVRRHPMLRNQFHWERPGSGAIELIGNHLMITLVSDNQGGLAAISAHFQPESLLQATAAQGTAPQAPNFQQGVIWLGDVLVTLGQPTRIQVPQRTGHMMRLFFPARYMVVTSYAIGRGAGRHLSVGDSVTYIGLSIPDWYNAAWRGPMLTATTWSGMAAYARYQGSARWP